jgi:hypothetical protein
MNEVHQCSSIPQIHTFGHFPSNRTSLEQLSVSSVRSNTKLQSTQYRDGATYRQSTSAPCFPR